MPFSSSSAEEGLPEDELSVVVTEGALEEVAEQAEGDESLPWEGPSTTDGVRGPPPSPKSKKAKPKSAPAGQSLTRAEVAILARMGELDPHAPRYQVLEAALTFKASWVILGEHLSSVARAGAYREWGYSTFELYCSDEVHVTAPTARKLVKSYDWLGSEAPEYIPAREGVKLAPQNPLPDLASVAVLADAKKELEQERVPEDAYLALKQAALGGEMTAAQLKKTLKESIPEHLQPKPLNDKVRHLRKALTAAVKTIDALREWDGGEDDARDATSDELLIQAEALRDAIALRLPRKDGAEA